MIRLRTMAHVTLLAFVLSALCAGEYVSAQSLTMDYAVPAGSWNEALPLGNGRLGAMVYGGPGMERIQLNEDTLWARGGYTVDVKWRGGKVVESRTTGGSPNGYEVKEK